MIILPSMSKIVLLAVCVSCAHALLFKHYFTSISRIDVNGNTTAGNVTNGKFQVFRISPRSENELALLNEIYRNNVEFQLDFWKAPTGIGEFVDIMVNPESRAATIEFLNDHDISHSVIIDDVQRLIIEREKSSRKPLSTQSTNPLLMSFFSKRMKDEPQYSSRNRAKYAFGEYHSYEEMLRWMADIEKFYPHMARVFTIGRTYEDRPIRGIRIGNPINDMTKRAIWIDGGMHAREWAAIHTALYFIEQLISLYGIDQKITSYVDTLNFYIVPVANPDGFEYSRSDVTPQTRFWRKNRGQQTCTKDRWRRERCCGGVDLNRNFDFHWGEIGSSGDICSDIFQGSAAFSEPESRAIRDKILSPELNGRLDAFITLHTYSQMWIHPYNHERKSFPEDINELQNVGKQGVKAIERVYGTKFRFGTGADILYPSAGGSDDWAKAYAKVKFVYLLELRPGEDEWDGFLLDRRQLIPTGKETWEGVKTVIDAVMRKSRGLSSAPLPFPPPPPRMPINTPRNYSDIVTEKEKELKINTTFPPTQFLPTFATTPTVTRMPLTMTLLTVTTWPTTTFSPPTRSQQQQTFQQQQIQQQHQQHLQKQTQQQQLSVAAPPPTSVATQPGFEISRRGEGALRIQQHQQQLIFRQQQQVLAMRAQARREYEQRLQLAEQRRQLLFWRNQQNRLHSGCSDRSPWCTNWIRVSPRICETSTVYMRQDCRSSCGFCAIPTEAMRSRL